MHARRPLQNYVRANRHPTCLSKIGTRWYDVLGGVGIPVKNELSEKYPAFAGVIVLTQLPFAPLITDASLAERTPAWNGSTSCCDVFLHLDKHLGEVIRNYGAWTYAILFVIVFCETGLVVTPFLPGDSLLFAAARCRSRRAQSLVAVPSAERGGHRAATRSTIGSGRSIGPRAFSGKSAS